ncbi:hypothetical protein Pmani_016332 [Petrolisthes manimaculis]|uniref:Uncharacterized protein n=1 Tax=Petrolisthes manimaculis TaxID=1843537 RepID=A0AAE1PQG6_9EUCA|nr:hypothetical protein Pmani_016332 [Petrolisthes manimaculis]
MVVLVTVMVVLVGHDVVLGKEKGKLQRVEGNENMGRKKEDEKEETVRRSPFVPRPGKRGGEEDASDLMDAEEQLNDNLAKYLDQQQQQQQQQEAAPATDMKRGNGFAFTPRLGKKSFAFVPRPGKKGDFAFTPRLGKKADFAFVPRPGRRGDFAFTPRLGKKADFAFTPRLGKKADFAFTPRLGKREVAVVEEEEA